MLGLDPHPCELSKTGFCRVFGVSPGYGLVRLRPRGPVPFSIVSAILDRRWPVRMTWLLIIVLFDFRFVRLAAAIGHVHATQHVVGEEKFAVRRHHHDLQLVG